MSIEDQLSQYFEQLVRRNYQTHRDFLFQARGYIVDHLNGRLDVLRKLTREKFTAGYEDLQSGLGVAKEQLTQEAAKLSKDTDVRRDHDLDPKDQFCPHRFSRAVGQIDEYKAILDNMAVRLFGDAIQPS